MLLIPAPDSKDSTAQVLMFWWSLSLKSGRVRWFRWCFHCFPGEMCVGECSPRKIRDVSNPMVSVSKGGSSHLDDGWPWLVGFWSSQSSFSQKKTQKDGDNSMNMSWFVIMFPMFQLKSGGRSLMLREFKDPGIQNPCKICLLDLVSKTMFDDKKKWQIFPPLVHDEVPIQEDYGVLLFVKLLVWQHLAEACGFLVEGGPSRLPDYEDFDSWKMVVEMLKTWKYEVITCCFFHLSHSGNTFRSFWGLLEGFNHIWDGPKWQTFLFRQLEPGTFQYVMLPEKGLHQTCRSPIALNEETVMFDGWKNMTFGFFSCIHKSSIFTGFSRIFMDFPS